MSKFARALRRGRLLRVYRALVVGVLFGTPTGLFFSVSFLPLIRYGCRRPRSVDIVARTERFVGVWFRDDVASELRAK